MNPNFDSRRVLTVDKLIVKIMLKWVIFKDLTFAMQPAFISSRQIKGSAKLTHRGISRFRVGGRKWQESR
jgi:hypothetical protein